MHGRIAADGAAFVDERVEQRLEMGFCNRFIDQQRLRRAAYTRAAKLGVEHNRDRHREIGFGVDIDVANAFEMSKHRHPCLVLHARDKAFAPARDDDINRTLKPREHQPDSIAFARWHELDRIFGQASRAKPRAHRIRNQRRGAEALGTAAQKGGISAFKAQSGGIRRDIGAAFEDHADDAERRRHALETQAVGLGPFGKHATHGIVERGDIGDRLGDGVQARGIEF